MGHLDLTDLASFKVWAKQNPSHFKVLKEIAFRQRVSRARVAGDPVPWAAYLHKQWREWLDNMPERTFERRLTDLVGAGLIERGRHRFSGTTVLAWLRPTMLALAHLSTSSKSTGKKSRKGKVSGGAVGGTVGGTLGGGVGGTLGGTDYTQPSNCSTDLLTDPSLPEGGKAGMNYVEETLKKYVEKIAVKWMKAKHDDLSAKHGTDLPFDPTDPLIASAIQQTAKKLPKLLDVYPPMIGPHETSKKPIFHPCEYNPAWIGWSAPLQAKFYAGYKQIVANWYAKHGGQPTVLKVEKPVVTMPKAMFDYGDPNAPKKKPSGGGSIIVPKVGKKTPSSGL